MTDPTTKPFDYSEWRAYAYGNAKPPSVPGAQWTAWISAGGQHDAVVCHGPNKESVLALRKHMLKGMVNKEDAIG
jgi:hypothetical protein